MGCITSKAITRSMSIREELRHGFQSRSAAWEELLTSHSAKLKTTTFTSPSPDPPPTDAETAPDPCKFTRSRSFHTLGETEMLGENTPDLRSLSFHTVEEYDALLERIRAEVDVESCQAEDRDGSGNDDFETGWKRKAAARGLKTLDIWPVEQKMAEQGQIYSPGTYVTPKFGSYNAPAIAMPQNESKQDAVFSPELLAAFEDCMQQLQIEEDTILKHMVDYSFENDLVNSSNIYKPIDI